MDLEKRIQGLRHSESKTDYLISVEKEDVKQLIRDVLDYVKPPQSDIPKNPGHNRLVFERDFGRAAAIRDMETKVKELGL